MWKGQLPRNPSFWSWPKDAGTPTYPTEAYHPSTEQGSTVNQTFTGVLPPNSHNLFSITTFFAAPHLPGNRRERSPSGSQLCENHNRPNEHPVVMAERPSESTHDMNWP